MSDTAAAPVKYAGRSYIVECAAVMGRYVAAILGWGLTGAIRSRADRA